jgi:hypothetical protein
MGKVGYNLPARPVGGGVVSSNSKGPKCEWLSALVRDAHGLNVVSAHRVCYGGRPTTLI